MFYTHMHEKAHKQPFAINSALHFACIKRMFNSACIKRMFNSALAHFSSEARATRRWRRMLRDVDAVQCAIEEQYALLIQQCVLLAHPVVLDVRLANSLDDTVQAVAHEPLGAKPGRVGRGTWPLYTPTRSQNCVLRPPRAKK